VSGVDRHIQAACLNLAGKKEIKIMAIDPGCHMEVDEKRAQWASKYEGQTYYVCVQ
jgi:hypothetical protein